MTIMTKNVLRAACVALIGVALAAQAALVITATVSGGPSGGGGGGLTECAGLTPTHYGSVSGAGTETGASWANAIAWEDYRTGSPSAGDVICLAAGTYTATNTDSRNTVAHSLAASGSAGNPITVVARWPGAYLPSATTNPDRTEFTNGLSTGDDGEDGSPAIGCNGPIDYVRWVGAVVNVENSRTHGDTGPVVLWDSTGCEIHQSYIQGYPVSYVDNYNGVRLEYAFDSVVKNNIIAEITRTTGGNHNVAGIMMYGARNFTITHNEIFTTNAGVYVKGADPFGDLNSGTISYNLIRDVQTGLDLGPVQSAQTLVAEHNIIHDFSARGIGYENSAGGSYNRNTTVRNNTIAVPSVATASGVEIEVIDASGNEISDNLISLADNASAMTINGFEYVAANSNFTGSDGNHVYQAGGSHRFAWDGSTTTVIATFQTDSGFTNTQTGTPDFVNAGAGDFHLGGSTTATGKGAYLTGSEEIGLQASPAL